MANYNLTANGSTPWVPVRGELMLSGRKTFGGGTISIEVSDDGGVTSDALEDTFTAAFRKILKVGACHIRFTLSGATAPDVDLHIKGVDVRFSSKL